MKTYTLKNGLVAQVEPIEPWVVQDHLFRHAFGVEKAAEMKEWNDEGFAELGVTQEHRDAAFAAVRKLYENGRMCGVNVVHSKPVAVVREANGTRMRVKITCPFRLPGSHEIHEIGFRGGNNIELTTPFRLDGFFGKVGTNLEVIEHEKGKYGIVIYSDSLFKEDEQIDFIEKVSEYLSFLINKRESNPHYGTNIVELEWFEFKAIAIQESNEPFPDTLHISDALAISSTRTVTFDEEEISRGSYHDVLRFYYDGLRAEHAKRTCSNERD